VELLSNAFEVLARKFIFRTLLIPGVTEFTLVRTVAAVIVVITEPTTIKASAVIAGKLVVRAGHWFGTMM
jgi:hypothetical protein